MARENYVEDARVLFIWVILFWDFSILLTSVVPALGVPNMVDRHIAILD